MEPKITIHSLSQSFIKLLTTYLIPLINVVWQRFYHLPLSFLNSEKQGGTRSQELTRIDASSSFLLELKS